MDLRNILTSTEVGEVVSTTRATLKPTDTVRAAAEEMRRISHGSALICEEGKLVGIFTERDILRRVVAEHRDPAATTLREVMSDKVITCQPETTLNECIGVMTSKRIRHLPVVGNEGLCGIITAGDLLAFQVKDQAAIIRYLKSYSFDVGGEG